VVFRIIFDGKLHFASGECRLQVVAQRRICEADSLEVGDDACALEYSKQCGDSGASQRLRDPNRQSAAETRCGNRPRFLGNYVNADASHVSGAILDDQDRRISIT
jgi:hypothetical protein